MRAARAVGGMGHRNTPLVVRASLPRTFWSLGVFVEASLCFVGFYLLLEVLKNPLEVDQPSVIVAGVVLALATVLLFYMIGPKRADALANEEDRSVGEEMWREAPLTAYGESMQARKRAEEKMNKEVLPGPM